jgi:type IV pilus assembly protein PilY1
MWYSPRKWLTALLSLGLVLLAPAGRGQDIDLYVGVPPGATNQPRVLIILDNTANWNSVFDNLKAALSSTVNNLNANMKVGLMLFTESGGGNSNNKGAYVRAAVRTMDSDYKTALQNLVNSIDQVNDKGDQALWSLAMAEAYAYFAGKNCNTKGSQNEYWCVGHGQLKRDYAGNTYGTPDSKAVYALPGNAFASSASTTYVSPIPSGVNDCAANYIIFISNGPPNDATSVINQSTKILQQAGGSTTTIPLTPNGQQDNIADEWARFLAQAASGKPTVYTYAVDVNPGSTGQGPAATALLKSMAHQGKGRYFAVNGSSSGGAEIAATLSVIFSEIQSANSVFASASLPLNAQAQGTYLNQVFVGLFRPQEDAHPRWDGNLKQYQFKLVGTGSSQTLQLVDADNQPALGSSDLFTPCARSFWTPAAVDSYWSFAELGTTHNPGSKRPAGQCSAVSASAWSNYPDGNLVERGGAAYRLRALSVASRNVLTCSGTCTGTPAAFATSNTDITYTALGVDSAERDGLINWIRGQDLTWTCGSNTCGNENGNANTTEMRPSVHADVVHGRPLPIHFPAHGGVVVFYGANDGSLRAINGNKDGGDQIGGRNPGEELWAFIAPEHYGQFKRLRDQSPLLDYPGAPTATPARQRKSWFFDGTIGAWRDGSSVWIYPTMRRGGRMLYAFDVSNPTSPSLKWKRGCPHNLAAGSSANDTSCDTGFASIGQTWSEPRVVRVQGHPKPVMIVGGGYDPCEDSEPNTCSSPKGNRVFVLDADTGELLMSLNTIRSVAADITVVDTDANGYVDLAYAVDTGGNIWRINIGASAPTAWTITQVAALGCDTTPCPASGTLNRKFLHAPEIVVTAGYNAILVGSGDREHPLIGQQAYNVANAFFMVQDKPTDAGWLSDEAGSCGGQNLICLASLNVVDAPNACSALPALPANLNGKKGWALRFGNNPAGACSGGTSNHQGEQVVTSAVVVGGVVYFSTHAPTTTACGLNLGLARSYALNFLTMAGAKTGGIAFTHFAGGGLPPSPVAGIVTVNAPGGGTVNVPFVIGVGSTARDNPLAPILPQISISGQRSRVYWYVEK